MLAPKLHLLAWPWPPTPSSPSVPLPAPRPAGLEAGSPRASSGEATSLEKRLSLCPLGRGAPRAVPPAPAGATLPSSPSHLASCLPPFLQPAPGLPHLSGLP